MQTSATTQVGTQSDDYGDAYYRSHLGVDAEEYDWSSPEWRNFFSGLADRVIHLRPIKNSLDVGCAKGLLVQALLARGVDAYGTDISSYAVESAHSDVRARLRVANAVEAIEGTWDIISCIEVLEHMSRSDSERAIDNMCAATDLIMFSSSPTDFAEPSHINVRTPAAWAASFAERGFYRRTDIDAGFLTPWAVIFEKIDLTQRDLVDRYEGYAHPMRMEVIEKRAALLDAERHREQASGSAQAELEELRHKLLNARDHAIGAEAAVATARRETEELRAELAKAIHELHSIKDSERWKAGGWVVSPLSGAKRIRRS